MTSETREPDQTPDVPDDAPDGLRREVPLAPLTTLNLGGPARWLMECGSVEDVRSGLQFGRRRDLPVAVLGEGSNVIVPDEGFPGLVLSLPPGELVFHDTARGATVVAGAGGHWDDLVAESVRRGLSGIECLSGIPGTVGAAPLQNIGAYGQELAEPLSEVLCLDRATLETVSLTGGECGFRYRDSRFKSEDRGRFIILGVTLQLRSGVRPELRYDELRRAVTEKGAPPLGELPAPRAVSLVRETVLRLRRRKSMVVDPVDPESRSVGSFFLNPVLTEAEVAELEERCARTGVGEAPPVYPVDDRYKVPAAWLVEQSGYHKGLRRGGVGISANHALALVHRGGGSASELLALGEEIRQAVHRRFDVRLEREPTLFEPGAVSEKA